MMRRTWLALLFLSAGPLVAQEDAEGLKTQGLKNGRWWAEQRTENKIYYLVGVMDGAGYILTRPNFKTNEPSVAEALRVYQIKTIELVVEIDRFYNSEILNAPIPVTAVLAFINKKATGTPEAELQKYTAELRRRWNQ